MSGSAAVVRRAAHLIGDDALARLLVQRRLLPEEIVERSFRRGQEEGTFVEEMLIGEGHASAEELLRELESFYFCPSVRPERCRIAPELARLVPKAVALRRLALPIGEEGDALVVALAVPDDRRALDEIRRACHRPILPVVALRHELRAAVMSVHAALTDETDETEGADETAGPDGEATNDAGGSAPGPRPAPPAPVAPARDDRGERFSALLASTPESMRVVDAIFAEAVERGATDVHFEPREDALGVRFRVDGVLRSVASVPSSLAASIASRLKVIGGMDIAERRAPQDGRTTLDLDGRRVDVRLSALPSRWGEKIVARLLVKDSRLLSLDGLEMPGEIRRRHREMVESPMGLFLVTGPTGSGKTTTLYATLLAVDRESLGVVTLEDPIEYELPGVTQVQVSAPAGLTFAAGLHSILRQDPDVILVGEIRDAMTAEIACQAALTGHRVLSTLHSNDSCQAVTRLVDMGVEPHLIAATLRGSMAQRLLRACCASCRTERPVTDDERQLLGPDTPTTVWSGPGCEACAGTGYRGRIGVFEYLVIEEDLRPLLLQAASAGALREAARRRGMSTLVDAGREALASGRTSFEEVRRVLLAEDAAGAPCPGCSRPVREDFDVCPRCRHVLRHRCAGCHAPVDPEWLACPGCRAPLERSAPTTSCARCAAPLGAGWRSCPFCGEGAA